MGKTKKTDGRAIRCANVEHSEFSFKLVSRQRTSGIPPAQLQKRSPPINNACVPMPRSPIKPLLLSQNAPAQDGAVIQVKSRIPRTPLQTQQHFVRRRRCHRRQHRRADLPRSRYHSSGNTTALINAVFGLNVSPHPQRVPSASSAGKT